MRRPKNPTVVCYPVSKTYTCTLLTLGFLLDSKIALKIITTDTCTVPYTLLYLIHNHHLTPITLILNINFNPNHIILDLTLTTMVDFRGSSGVAMGWARSTKSRVQGHRVPGKI